MNRAIFTAYTDSTKTKIVKEWGISPCDTEQDAWESLKSMSGNNYRANRALMSVRVEPIRCKRFGK